MHLSTVNEASNFSANSIQAYHSPGYSFKYTVVFSSLFLYLCCYWCVLSSIYFGFYLSERWDKEMALYQCCSLMARGLSSLLPALLHTGYEHSPPGTERANIWWRLYHCSDLFFTMHFQEHQVSYICVWTISLILCSRSPFQVLIKLSFRVLQALRGRYHPFFWFWAGT